MIESAGGAMSDEELYGLRDDDSRAEDRARDAEEERADRAMSYADGRFSNYPEGWGDAPW